MPQNKVFPRDQGSGNQLLEDNFKKSAFRRVMKFEFKSYNQLPFMCKRLPATELFEIQFEKSWPFKI